MKCVIIAGGNVDGSKKMIDLIRGCDLIICADGGAGHLRRYNLLPHAVIGDFDSIQADDKAFFTSKGVELLAFPPQKDKTDSELCIDYALKKKATDITLLGSTGTRLDHTLANIFLLRKLCLKKIQARIIDRFNEIHVVTRSICLNGAPGDYVSLIPISETVEGITLKGLAYPLTDACIAMGSSLGISNCFKDSVARIDIAKGTLIVTKSRDNPL